MHKKLKDMSEIKNSLIKWVSTEIEKGKELCCSTYEETQAMGEVVDMIKDLAEAEKECMEACYYKSIIEAMEEESEKEPEDREWGEVFGYNNRRYSSGRYAPSGRGYMGYTPSYNMMDNPENRDNYHKSQIGTTSRYGYSYNQYRDAKRHYTESNSLEEKHKMSEHAKEHLDDTVMTMRDIWKDADPELKTRMKNELTKLVNEMV